MKPENFMFHVKLFLGITNNIMDKREKIDLGKLSLYFVLYTLQTYSIFGASRSKPHTYHSYEKITVPMYLCMYLSVYVAVCHPRAHHTIAHVQAS